MHVKQWKSMCLLVMSLITAAFMLGGCSGDDGTDGINGLNAGQGTVDAATLPTAELADLQMEGAVTSVSVNGKPVVMFSVKDANGNPVKGLGIKNAAGTALNNMGFAIAKLIPANATTGAPSKWVSYIVTNTTSTDGSRPTTDNTGTLVDFGNGSYQYTFARDISLVKGVIDGLTDSGNKRKADLGDLTYDPTLTHRVVVQIGGNILNTSPSIPFENPLNLILDFIPATGKVVTAANTQREIVLIDSCNECHDKLAFHGGEVRIDSKFCVVCHTSQRAWDRAPSTSVNGVFTGSTYIADGEVAGEMVTMIHKIHMGNGAFNAKSLTKTGYNYAGVLFEKLGYPMNSAICLKCHRTTPETPQAVNYAGKPSRIACGACHDNVNFATGANHPAVAGGAPGNIQTTDANCALCHTVSKIKGYHAAVNKTTFNPEVPTGLVNFTYEISSAAIVSGVTTVKFRILKDGTAITLDGTGANPLVGFSGSPSFLLAWSKSATNQPITTFADYNNYDPTVGGNAAQPISVSIATLKDGTRGTLSAPAADGTYTATFTNATYNFPADAKLRAVALQGYFTQLAATNNIGVDTGRHTVSVWKQISGDAVRRTVVDSAKCGKCHEWFEGHGGNRVYEAQVCVMCHVPNLSSSGRGISDAILNPWVFTAEEQAILTSWNFSQTATNAALNFPESSQNFKELIHGIHAGKDRTNPLRFVRDRASSGVIVLFDVKEIGYPGILENCEGCHVTPTGPNRQTYKADLPAGVLETTNLTGYQAATPAAVVTARGRAVLPSTTDLVTGPVAGACASCHDTPAAVAHMNINGAGLTTSRVQATGHNIQGAIQRQNISISSEQCAICHGEGKSADVVEVHK